MRELAMRIDAHEHTTTNEINHRTYRHVRCGALLCGTFETFSFYMFLRHRVRMQVILL